VTSEKSFGSNIASASDVEEYTSDVLKQCPSDTYVIVNQPGVSIADFTADTTPHLTRWASAAKISTRRVTENVRGLVDLERIRTSLEKQCKTSVLELEGSGSRNQFRSQWFVLTAASDVLPSKNELPQIITLNLPTPSLMREKRTAEISAHG